MATRAILEELPTTRAAIFRLLKNGYASIPQIASALGVSHEAARKQIVELQRKGWIEADCPPDEAAQRDAAAGRPPVRYCLTPAGDHFFPKQYPEMGMALLDGIADAGGQEALTAVLTRITDMRVAELESRIENLSLPQKVDALRAIYREGDSFTDVQRRGDDYVLIERNCPYLDLALERPDICSTTVSALRRLTGCEVVRERRFQDRDGRCEFHVRTAHASRRQKETRFEREPPRTT